MGSELIPHVPFSILCLLGALFGGDPIARLFRLEPASPAAARWSIVAVALVLLALVAACAAHDRRRIRKARRAEERELGERLRAAGLDDAEREAFGRVCGGSKASGLRCATSVVDFDRGVRSAIAAAMPATDRADLLAALASLRRKLRLHACRPGAPILSTRVLPANLPVQISVPGTAIAGLPAAGLLLSVAEDTLTVRLEGPAGEAAEPFRGRDEVEVFFVHPLDAAYAFRAPVVSVREVGAAFLVLGHPESLGRTQGRSFARVNVREPICLSRIPALRSPRPGTPPDDRGAAEEIRATITSVSGGGVRIVSPLPLERGDCVRIALPFLPEHLRSEPCFARVVRARGDGSFGLRFEGMAERTQAAILQFVRREEVRRRREADGKGDPPARKGD